jgi:hypothetical protein
MLDEETLKTLAVNDQLQLEPLLKGLTDEPVLLRVTMVSETDIHHVEFAASYCGIDLGIWICRAEALGIAWSGVPV